MPDKSKKVLLFSTAYLPHIGGAELAIKETTDRLPNIEFDLITAKLKRGLPDFEKIGNINVYRIGAGNKIFDKPLLPNLGFLKAISLHKKKRYDLIHGIMASQGSAAGYLFKFFYPRVPFILTLQEGDLVRNSPFDKFWQRRIIKKADAITAISGYLVEFAKRYNKKAPVHIVPNGVDPNKFQISKSKSQINSKFQNPNQKTIITVSRLVRKNGVDILIKAVKKLTTYNLQLTTLIIGEGKERKKLEKLARKLGVAEKVRFLGSIPNEKIPEHLVGADIFVRPSRSEGLGTAFLEAMAVGLPLIGTPVGGITDFLKDQETGLFCEPDNPDDLAEKINRLLTDENLRANLIKNGRKLIEKKYSWDTIAEQMRIVYEKNINRHSGI
ncbi:MAG: hypothetical protein G01um10142_361 [Parcubacteria group bacterium Gr01-1014_2]|nr:MAG: hypothetical protein G01um10142_361 [Parcubacteria group bacterium Gr01-1014_2]